MSWEIKVPGMDKLPNKLPGVEDLPGAEAVTGLLGAAIEKLMDLMDQYNQAVALLEKFGFTVTRFSVEMKLPPEANTSIKGSMDKLPESELKALAEAHKDAKITALILNTLVLAKQIHARVKLPFNGVRLDLTIALKPNIGWTFEES